MDAATGDPKRMDACVRCGSIRIIRKGRGHDGSQRWKCMDCGRTFGVRPNRVMGMSKLKAGVWMRFLECFVDCLSLRKCADGHAINRVNTLHARLEDFMFGFHGVSTKYLQVYLDRSQWLGAFTDGFGETDEDRLPARQPGNGLYRIRRRGYQRMAPPYMDHWQKAA